MRTIKDALIAEGFSEKLINEKFSLDNYHLYDLDSCESIYVSIVSFMREDFDDWFILEMFASYPAQFMSSSRIDDLLSIKACFNSDMWSTYIQYEFSETGISSIFELMDCMVVGEFEEKLEETCKKVKAIWVNGHT